MQNRYIIFGMGELFQTCCTEEIKEKVIAYTDNSKINPELDKPFIFPRDILKWEFDYVVIFSSKYFEEIYTQLTYEVGVAKEKIISCFDLIQCDRSLLCREYAELILKTIHNLGLNRVLDLFGSLAKYYFHKNAIPAFQAVGLNLDIFQDNNYDSYPLYHNLYHKSLTEQELHKIKPYDAAIGLFLPEKVSPDQGKRILMTLKKKTRYLFVRLPYPFTDTDKKWNDLDLTALGNIIYQRFCKSGQMVMIDTQGGTESQTESIYVVSHKEFLKPQDSLYTPLYVGEFAKEHRFEQSEFFGENIAQYNQSINEITALYWMWKNTEDNIIGLCHYRRYFLFQADGGIHDILRKGLASRILEKYDIILPQERYLGNVKKQLQMTVDRNAFEKGWEVITKAIQNKQKDYTEAFEYVLQGAKIYPCNMFVTKRTIMAQYCEWLFSFLLDAADSIDLHGYDDYSKRIIGFFAERLFTVWLIKQDLKVMELPILEIK